jgi:hypothetical protein
MAIAYEVIFETSIAELFPGLHETVEAAIEKQIAGFESRLVSERDKQRAGPTREVGRKLAWLAERRQRRAMKK